MRMDRATVLGVALAAILAPTAESDVTAPFEVAGSFATGSDPYSMVLADVDGDGHADLAVRASVSKEVVLFRGAGDGTFAEAARVPLSFRPVAAIPADFDGDGVLDVVANSGEGATVSDLAGTATFAFAPAIDVAVTGAQDERTAKCKVTAWPGDAAAGTGPGALRLRLPKRFVASNVVLEVTNSVGTGSIAVP